ncbi:MAG: SpoIIE family protein phosphatase [Phycisphaerae bacterium]|nr:SpoIIE family protein phosphatase [Phycisphaerae bacterium]
MDTASPLVRGNDATDYGAHVDSPHVQVILNAEAVPPNLATALDRTHAAFSLHRFNDVGRQSPQSHADAIVVVVPGDQSAVRPDIERVFASLAKRPCGTLVMTEGPLNGLAAAVRPPELPISFVIAPTADELTARLTIICEYGAALRHIKQEAAEMLARSQQMASEAQHLDEQLRLASQVQRDFLPHHAPVCDGVRFVTLYRPADYVSGDIYDIARLDETHLGISVADVTGHGVPAALLTLFVKRAWRAKEISEKSYRIIPPDEMLYRLNHELLEADLEQCQFVTACCAVYDQTQRVITWARGGLPYPILIRAGRPPTQIRSAGELVGAFDHAHFELRRENLEPGDALIFFTDGLEALLLGGSDRRCDRIEETEWFTNLGQGPIEDHFDQINRELDRMANKRWPRDDVTMVAIIVDH